MVPLPLLVSSQSMPGDIADRFSEGVPDPTPLAPSNLDVDNFLFSSEAFILELK